MVSCAWFIILSGLQKKGMSDGLKIAAGLVVVLAVMVYLVVKELNKK